MDIEEALEEERKRTAFAVNAVYYYALDAFQKFADMSEDEIKAVVEVCEEILLRVPVVGEKSLLPQERKIIRELVEGTPAEQKFGFITPLRAVAIASAYLIRLAIKQGRQPKDLDYISNPFLRAAIEAYYDSKATPAGGTKSENLQERET